MTHAALGINADRSNAAASPTTTGLTLSPATVSFGTSVTLTAAVTRAGGPLPAGQVVFCDATRVAACLPGSANLIGLAQITPAGTASLRFRTGVGVHKIVAHFVGTTLAGPSTSSTAALTVAAPGGPLPTQTNLNVNASSNNYQNPRVNIDDLMATVSAPPGSPSPSGNISFNVTTPAATTVLATAALTPVKTAADFTLGGIQSPIIADFNEDGIPDTAYMSSTTAGGPLAADVSVGAGDGTFLSGLRVQGGGCAAQQCILATADFNGDGHADLALLQPAGAGFSLSLSYGVGDGAFTTGPTVSVVLPASATRAQPQLLVGDFNGDGRADLLVNNGNGGTSAVPGVLAVLLQQADGLFQVSYPASFGAAGLLVPAVLNPGDINNDGKMDIVGAPLVGPAYVFLSNGDGTFTASSVGTTPPLLNGAEAGVLLGDFTGDGVPDIALTTSYGIGGGYLLVNDGHGSLTQGGEFPEFNLPQSISVIDVNGDGLADLVLMYTPDNPFPGNPGVIFADISDGKGQFTEPSIPLFFTAGAYGLCPAVTADLNGDGLQDLVCPFGLINQSGYSVATAALPGETMPVGANLLLTASYVGQAGLASSLSPGVTVQGNTAQTTLQIAASPQTAMQGQPVTFTATLSPYTADGFSTDGETVTFGSVTATPAIDVTATLKGGVASATVTSLPLGTNGFFANYGGDGTFNYENSTNQASVTITPALSPAVLNGKYTFLVQGTLPAAGGPAQGIAAAGMFFADGNGLITRGTEDVNSATLTASGVALTGSYTVHADGTFTLHLLSGGMAEDFGAVPAQLNNVGAAQQLALIGLGSGGAMLSGSAIQTSFDILPYNLNGGYTLALQGETACQASACGSDEHPGGAVSMVSSQAIQSQSTGSGQAVFNAAGSIFGVPSLGVSLTAADTNARFTLTLTGPDLPRDAPTHFAGYFATATEVFVISTDPHASRILLSGTLIQK